MLKPQIIFLDAVGTLFGVRGTVGDIYGRFAQAAGVTVDAEKLNRAFFESFQAAPRAAFPGVAATDLPAREYDWWLAIARQSFAKAGVLEHFDNFDQFFLPLFEHFALADPWVVYPEVPSFLQQWQCAGIKLAVISNFDSRLHTVLAALGLAEFFHSVTISTAVGAAKPDPSIFNRALTQHQYSPEQAWHIGDSWHDDYQGATAAGLTGIWLNREGRSPPKAMPAQLQISTLSALPLSAPEQDETHQHRGAKDER